MKPAGLKILKLGGLGTTAHFLQAQSSSIDWHTIDGGGTSTGGIYSLSGGFWALSTAIQVIGAPTLTIVPATPGQATISWTPNTPGCILQETRVLSPANWTNSLSGSTNPTSVSATNVRSPIDCSNHEPGTPFVSTPKA